MARVIGDSGLYFYIQDVIVLPQYQKMGIGILMMERVMNFLDNNLSPLAFCCSLSFNRKPRVSSGGRE